MTINGTNGVSPRVTGAFLFCTNAYVGAQCLSTIAQIFIINEQSLAGVHPTRLIQFHRIYSCALAPDRFMTMMAIKRMIAKTISLNPALVTAC